MDASSLHVARRRFGWARRQLGAFLFAFLQAAAYAGETTTSGLDQFITPLKSGLNLIVVFGFIAGCVMVMGGFLNARRDENWKMTVIYGIGVAGAVVLMKALFTMFGGQAATTVNGF
jgi:hypothetical protein